MDDEPIRSDVARLSFSVLANLLSLYAFFFQAEDGIRDIGVTGVQTCALPIYVVVTPGELDQHMRMIAGRWTVEFIAELSFAVAFVSAAGVTLDQGLTTARRAVADVTHAARASALRTVALMDATKFRRRSLLSIAPAQDFDAIVTDDALAADVADEFRAAGVRLEIANPQEGL